MNLSDMQINIVNHVFVDVNQFGWDKFQQKIGSELVKSIEISYGNIVEIFFLVVKNKKSIWLTKMLLYETRSIFALIGVYEKKFMKSPVFTNKINSVFSNIKSVRNGIAHIEGSIQQVYDSIKKGTVSSKKKQASRKSIKFRDPNQWNEVIVDGRIINVTSFGPGLLFSFGGFVGDEFVVTDTGGKKDHQLLRIDIQNKEKRVKVKDIIQCFFESINYIQDWKSLYPKEISIKY